MQVKGTRSLPERGEEGEKVPTGLVLQVFCEVGKEGKVERSSQSTEGRWHQFRDLRKVAQAGTSYYREQKGTRGHRTQLDWFVVVRCLCIYVVYVCACACTGQWLMSGVFCSCSPVFQTGSL